MSIVIKAIWITAITVDSVALSWILYLVITNRPIGLAAILAWIPALLILIILIVLLFLRKVPTNASSQAALALFLIVFTFIFSGALLYSPIATERMVQEVAEKNRQFVEENYRTTVDEKYQYKLFLVGTLTDNPRAHISIRDIADENLIAVDIDLKMKEIRSDDELPMSSLLIDLSPTDVEYIYILTTTPYLKGEIEVFEVDLLSKTSRRIE